MESQKQIESEAQNLRKAAGIALHDASENGYAEISRVANVHSTPIQDLNKVACSLEKGNDLLSSAPVAKVERDSSGDVTAINFTPGLFDFGSNSKSVRIGVLSARYGLANDYHLSRQGNHKDKFDKPDAKSESKHEKNELD